MVLGRPGRYHHINTVLLCLAMVSALSSGAAVGQHPAEDYEITRQWRASDGLPVDSAYGLALDASGRLWVATHDGLVRFNGLEFTHFNTESDPPLPTNRLAGLQGWRNNAIIVHNEDSTFGLFDESGYLALGETSPSWVHPVGDEIWFVEADQLIRWNAGQGKQAVTTGGAVSLSRLGDRLLLGTTSGEIFEVNTRTGELTHRATIGSDPVLASSMASDGRIAAIDPHRVLMVPADGTRPDPASEIPLSTSAPRLVQLAAAEDHWLLAGLTEPRLQGVNRYDGRRLEPVAREALTRFRPNTFVRRSGDGELWVNEGDRLLHNGRVAFNSQHLIFDFHLDRYGQIWLATLRDGLLRLARPRLTTLGTGPGELSDPSSYHVSTDGDVLMIGTPSGLYRHNRTSDQWQQLTDGNVRAILPDQDSLLVAGTGMCRLRESGECSPVPGFEYPSVWISLLYRDVQGAVWMGTQDGLFHRPRSSDQWRLMHSGSSVISVLALDNQHLWFGTDTHGVIEVDLDAAAPTVRRRLGVRNGLTSNHVRSFHRSADGDILIGTNDRGLCLYRPGAGLQRCVSTADGLPHHSVHCMISADGKWLWFNTNDGIWNTREDHLLAFLEDPSHALKVNHYRIDDGMQSEEGNGGVGSACAKSHDGHLWFANQLGLVQAPATPPSEPDWPVTLAIEPLDHPDDQDVILPYDARTLRVRMNPVALRGSGLIQFRYRLGSEEPWQDLGTQRELAFRSLAHGTHVLEAQARYADTSWNGPLAAMTIHVPQRLIERGLFWTGLGVALLALLLALLIRESLRGHQLERKVQHRTKDLSSALATVEQQAQELREAAVQRKQLFLTISHELRTPLTLILGPLEDSQQPLTPEQRDRMARSASQIRDMIDQILLLERADSAPEPERRPEEIAPLLRRVIERLTPAIDTAGMVWELQVDDDLARSRWRLPVDPHQFDLALGTLIGNAIKYTDAGSRLKISANLQTETATLRLYVDDNGPGIPPGERERVLQPFHRGDQDYGRQGLGLGLALCQRIIVQHQGEMHILDSPLGGARICLELPLVQIDESEAQTADTGDERPVILVVDDSPDIRAYARELLANRYQVLEAEHGLDGETMASRHLPDLLLTDISMPFMDGLEMVRRLRENDETAAIPVIFFTAHDHVDNELAAFRSGGDQLIAKPFSAAGLCARVERVLTARAEILRSLDMPTPPKGTTPDRFEQRLRETLDRELANSELDVDQLAGLLSMSRSSLYRRIAERYQMTPAEYLRTQRLDRAGELLRNSDYRVSEIAYAVGFKRLSTFTRSFTAHFGQPPSAWRCGESTAG